MSRFLTLQEFNELQEADKYWRGRWEYFNKVISIIQKEQFESVLELGPYKKSIVKDADIMDRHELTGKTKYIWDATNTPWPIMDKEYDLFLALQVWEHLEGKQKEAFSEVLRISGMAVLSFPYMWVCPGNCHHGIDNDKIREWTLGIEPFKRVEIAKRVICFYKF